MVSQKSKSMTQVQPTPLIEGKTEAQTRPPVHGAKS